MTESPEATSVDPARTPGVDGATRNTRPYQVLAWVGIIAGVVFIVGAVFFAGFVAGRSAYGYGWHRGYQSGQTRPDGSLGGCPMMQMLPGGTGAGGMGGMGGMGPGRMKGPSPTSMMPAPPMAGQR